MITRKQIEACWNGNNKKRVAFQLKTNWQNTSQHRLNDLVDDEVEDGHLLCDVSYEFVKAVEGTDEVVVRVIAKDLEEYFHPDNIESE